MKIVSMKWPRFQFSLRTLFLVTALIAVGLVAVRWWIGPHRLVIPSESDYNNYEFIHGLIPSGNIELEYYNELGSRKFVSSAYDVNDIVRTSANDYQNLPTEPCTDKMEYHFFTNMKHSLTDNSIQTFQEQIVRVVAEVNEYESAIRNQQISPELLLPNYRIIFLSNEGELYKSATQRGYYPEVHVLEKVSLDDVLPRSARA